ncbi:TPA: hypothetical protein ACH3X2_005298 [Trebouxia sp. C0005]
MRQAKTQEDFPGKFSQAKESLATASGMPQPSTLPSPPGLPPVITSVVTNGYPSVGNAASGPIPSMPFLAPTPPVSGMSLPFSATAGRHIKIKLLRPRRFTNIAADSDTQERGLKPEIAAEIKVDPLTYQGYTNIEKAQQAACACGAHYDPSSSTPSRKRDHPTSSSDTDSSSDTSDTESN